MQNILKFTPEQIKMINKASLATKHNCSRQYVGEVLRSEKGFNKKCELIRQDAKNLLSVLGIVIAEPNQSQKQS